MWVSEMSILSIIVLNLFLGNDTEWSVVQNAKFKQQNYTIDQSKLQGFKV